MKTLDINDYLHNSYYLANPTYFIELVQILNKSHSGFYRSLKYKTHLVDWVTKSLPLLTDPFFAMSTKISWILNDRKTFPVCTNPKCQYYQTDTMFKKKNIGIYGDYLRFCDRKCQNTHPKVKVLLEKNCYDKYGVRSTLQVKEFRNKGQQTMIDRYGYSNPGQSKKNHQIQLEKSYKNCILNNNYDVPCFTLEEYLERKNDLIPLKFKCLKCGNMFEIIHHNGFHHKCPKCYSFKYVSATEKDISEYISTIYSGEIIENTKSIISPSELDIYLPKLKIAFEFDGLYWHQDKFKSKTYHLNKTKDCEKRGIQLIHIFENEWLAKQNIVKSRIKNLLGIYDMTVFARKCEVKIVNSKTSREFQEQNHIQGAVNSSVNLGLFYDNELISLMTFSKTRFSKKYEWELVRFSNKLGYHIPGAAGKLLKYFERNYQPKSLVSYADRRWSQGKLYKALGFTLDAISPPNYWYWKDATLLESRIKYQKHKLKDLLPIFDESKTEIENMKDNSYQRIFDCGNYVFSKKY